MPAAPSAFPIILSGVLGLGLAPIARADQGEFLLIHRQEPTRRIRLVELNQDELVHLDETGWITVRLDECIALLDVERPEARYPQAMLTLADGQRFPGILMDERNADPEKFSWQHQLLGPLEVSLEDIATVSFIPGAEPPEAAEYDVIRLANGDRLEGLLVSLNDPVEIEIETEDGLEIVQVARRNVAAITVIATEQPTRGRRVWFDDGTVVEVDTLNVGDDGFVRFSSEWNSGRVEKLDAIDSILLDPTGMVPLAALPPDRVEGPSVRYQLPMPEVLWPEASLQLSPIDYRGPLVVRYLLPAAARQLVAEALVPLEARTWADFELIIRCDDREVFRQTMNADTPAASISVPLRGSELTIELTEGARGPIQDRLRLNMPILLLDSE